MPIPSYQAANQRLYGKLKNVLKNWAEIHIPLLNK